MEQLLSLRVPRRLPLRLGLVGRDEADLRVSLRIPRGLSLRLGLVRREEADLRVPLLLTLLRSLLLALRLEADLLRHLPAWRRVDGSCHRRPVLLGRGGLWSRVADEAGDR